MSGQEARLQLLEQNQPDVAFHVTATAQLDFTSADDGEIVVFNHEVLDFGDCYDQSNGKFTGTYIIQGMWKLTSIITHYFPDKMPLNCEPHKITIKCLTY